MRAATDVAGADPIPAIPGQARDSAIRVRKRSARRSARAYKGRATPQRVEALRRVGVTERKP